MVSFKFPGNFLYGTGCSCYQAEGSAYADGKTENIWDWATRLYPEKYKNTKTDPTSGFYKHFREDVAEMKAQGLKSFRFSISWTRIFPEKDGEINPKSVAFYNELIDLLLENEIEPFVDIFHWDLPVYLMETGGFSSREIIPYFTKFAKACFENFGDRVKLWSTMNEPSVFCISAFTQGHWPPYPKGDLKVALAAAHNALICHYRAVKLYKEMKLPGKIGAVIAIVPIYPADPGGIDLLGATLSMERGTLWWLDPMFLGKYPENIMRECPAYYEAMEGYAEELASEFAPMDIVGLNYYMPGIARYEENSPAKSTHIENYYMVEEQRFPNYPAGLYDSMLLVKKRYNNPEIYITENGLGISDNGNKEEMLNDDIRITYLREHLRMVVRSIEAGANVKGYYYWSNFDSFENSAGYTCRFGLNYVDFETGERTRKKSWYYYQKVIADGYVT